MVEKVFEKRENIKSNIKPTMQVKLGDVISSQKPQNQPKPQQNNQKPQVKPIQQQSKPQQPQKQNNQQNPQQNNKNHQPQKQMPKQNPNQNNKPNTKQAVSIQDEIRRLVKEEMKSINFRK